MRALAVTHVFPRHDDDPTAPFLLRHLRGVQEAGVEVAVLAPHDAGLPDEHEVGGIRVRRVRYGPDEAEVIAYRGEMHQLIRRPAGAWRAARLVLALRVAVRDELAAGGVDVVDVHWLVPGGIVARAAGLHPGSSGPPVQVNVHGTDVALIRRSRVTRRVGRVALGCADTVAAMSGPLADDLEQATGRRADWVQPMPIAVPAVTPDPGAARPGHVLAVGRLVPEKGHLDLLEAVARLRGRRPEVTLTIVGDGPEAGRLRSRAAALGVPLELPGACPPGVLERHYAAAAVVAVPSRREGFGLVAAEALARRRPVVATTAGGLADVVTPETGFPVPPGDVAALSEALSAALADPRGAAARAEAGARRVEERWSPEALGRQAADRLRALAWSRG